LTAQNKILSFKYPFCRLWESAARGGSTIRHTLATPLVIERSSGLTNREKVSKRLSRFPVFVSLSKHLSVTKLTLTPYS